MQKKISIIYMFVLILIILTGCESAGVSEEKDAQIKSLEQNNSELQEEVERLKTGLNYSEEYLELYEQAFEFVVKKASKSDLIQLANSQWEYSLTVNGVAMPTDGKLVVEDNGFDINITEQQSPFSILSDYSMIKGAISGLYYEHLLNFEPDSGEVIVWDGTTTQTFQHQYLNVKSGTTISFSITEELQERLGLDTTNIKVTQK